MCEWGTTKPVEVRIQAEESHTGQPYWRTVDVDACIAPIVAALQAAGIDMRGSCCGHGKGPGEITLADGRALFIADAEKPSATGGSVPPASVICGEPHLCIIPKPPSPPPPDQVGGSIREFIQWNAKEALRFLEWLGNRGVKLAVAHDIDHPLRVMELVPVRDTTHMF